jgi:hypothetical protein
MSFAQPRRPVMPRKVYMLFIFPLKWRLFLSLSLSHTHTQSTPREFSRLTTQTKFSFYKLEQRLHEFIRTTSLEFSILQIDGTTPSEKPYFTSYQDIETSARIIHPYMITIKTVHCYYLCK